MSKTFKLVTSVVLSLFVVAGAVFGYHVYTNKDVVIERDAFKVTLTQAECTNSEIIAMGSMIGLPGKLKAGKSEGKGDNKYNASLCYVQSPDGEAVWIIDENGGMGGLTLNGKKLPKS